MDLAEMAWGGVEWLGLAQDRDKWRALMNAIIEPSGSIKCWETIERLHNCWPLE
jgi:hypothetical protein